MKNLPTLLLGVSGFILLLLIFHSGCKEAEEEELDTTQLPTLSTLAIQEISSQSASGGGEITNDGGAPITSRGLVWNTSDNPTTETNEGKTTVGDGVGGFTSSLTNLLPYSTYYVRAYAINSKGTNVVFENLLKDNWETNSKNKIKTVS